MKTIAELFMEGEKDCWPVLMGGGGGGGGEGGVKKIAELFMEGEEDCWRWLGSRGWSSSDEMQGKYLHQNMLLGTSPSPLPLIFLLPYIIILCFAGVICPPILFPYIPDSLEICQLWQIRDCSFIPWIASQLKLKGAKINVYVAGGAPGGILS